MKKRLIQFALLCVLMTLTCGVARATETATSGLRDVTVEDAYKDLLKLTPVDTTGNPVTVSDGTYPGATKVQAVYTGSQANSEYLLFALTEDGIPGVDNLAYIDQKTASGTNVTYTIYPKKVADTETSVQYTVYLSSNAEGATGASKVASFTYYAAPPSPDVVPGDFNQDGYADMDDATDILKYDVGLISEEPSAAQLAAGDVDGNGYVEMDDATWILQYDVGIIDSFDEIPK